MFISRIELLPEDETTNEHHEAKRAEALSIDTDKGPGGEGLFKGAFARQNPALLHTPIFAPIRAIRDHEDGVDRCPMCAWELEEGACMHCGYNDSDEDDSDESDDTRALPSPSIISINSELDGDLDADDYDPEMEYDEDDGFVRPDRRANITYPPRPDVPAAYRNDLPPQRSQYHMSADSDNEDEEDEGEAAGHHSYAIYHRVVGEESDDEESDGNDTAVPDGHSYETATNDDDESMDSSDEDSDDEGDIISATRRPHYDHMSRSERDGTPLVAGPESPGSFYAEALAVGDPGYGFSPTRSASPNSTDDGAVRSPTPHTESGAEVQTMGQRRAAATNRIARRPARVVISSDEESDGSTPTPPRPVAERRRHLRTQRARRGGRGRGGGSTVPNAAWDATRQFRDAARR